MKKTTLLFILFLTGLMACSAPVTPEDKPKQQNNAAPAFQLFPTTNMWTFIKLDTRNGRMWQVQYDIQGDDRMEVVLNENYLAGNDCAGTGDSPFIPQKTCSHSFSSTNTMVECGKCNGLSMPTNGLLFL